MTTPEEREAMEWAEKKATEWEGLATHFHRLNQAFAHEMHAAEAARWRILLTVAHEAMERRGAEPKIEAWLEIDGRQRFVYLDKPEEAHKDDLYPLVRFTGDQP